MVCVLLTHKIIVLISQYVCCIFPFGIVDKIGLGYILPRDKIIALDDTGKVAAIQSRIAIAHTILNTVGLLLHNSNIGKHLFTGNAILGKRRPNAACGKIIYNFANLKSVYTNFA